MGIGGVLCFRLSQVATLLPFVRGNSPWTMSRVPHSQHTPIPTTLLKSDAMAGGEVPAYLGYY